MFTGGGRWTVNHYKSTSHLLLHTATSLFLFYSSSMPPGTYLAFSVPISQFYFIHALKEQIMVLVNHSKPLLSSFAHTAP